MRKPKTGTSLATAAAKTRPRKSRKKRFSGSAKCWPRHADDQVEAVRPDGEGIKEVVGDKGYHSNQSLVDL